MKHKCDQNDLAEEEKVKEEEGRGGKVWGRARRSGRRKEETREDEGVTKSEYKRITTMKDEAQEKQRGLGWVGWDGWL